MASPKRRKRVMSIADAASCALLLVALILLSYSRELDEELLGSYYHSNQDLERACDEIYVVEEGETLHTIIDKCGDPYIVEQNPHIHDPDDVFPGLVIRITPTN